jgi:hypothetical protein
LRRAGAAPRTARWPAALAACIAWLLGAPALAKPLDQLIPGLFGGSLSTTISATGTDQSRQQVLLVQRFQNLSAQLSVARSQVPIPSSSGAFSYAWDSELDTFVRSDLSLGSLFAERAQTLGRGRFNFGFSYQHVGFDTLDGDPLDNIRGAQAAFTSAYLANLPPEDRARVADDQILTQLSLSFTLDVFYLSAAYGVTDDIDVSLGMTISRAALSGHATAMTIDPTGNGMGEVAYFVSNQPGVITAGKPPICNVAFRCAEDTFDQSATGTGDIYLRSKWHVADFRYADLALAGVLTLPTGNADDFLGFHDPTFTPWLIASKPFGRFAPHVNIGYAIRSETDVSQFQWIAGADVLTTRWLTLVGDFLGYYDHVNHDVVQSSIGFKVNPIGGLVLSAGFQFPVTRDGLRADVIYTGQAEYNF